MGSLPIILLIIGFVAAITFGSVAWYNSKRPPGWERAKKPEVVPDLTPEQKRWPNTPNESDAGSPENVIRE
ncbi:photosystem II assembly protein Psb35 [Gloeobacter kilaueensis]|uniref:Uncharacterized protein n=1 Tax=Gloeobacter kilaueensis (strain ATCC BAA-2537 / CCAP 1431/1 / ULC 316 / JS1) TaxID=1183438 RepID=U5QPT5_GLOK1|nr:hypothetical protein [Gloeobacter kilaueensis]AGY59639.1 hypothetical protein GKIL_3393 [Gloeobacter kilaueensis JS1]